MKTLFSINHPSQYHMFKNLARKLVDEGNDVVFFIQSRGIIEQLIKADGFTYRYSASKNLRAILKGKYGIVLRGIITLIQQELSILFYCLTHKVKFLMGTDMAISHVGYFLRKPVFVFADDDYVFAKPYCRLTYPFATHIVAPKVTDIHKWENKKLAYWGTQKSAYLHPSYFKPDETVLDKYKLRGNRYFIIRLVTFNALHDSLHNASSGITEVVLDQLIPMLKNQGKVLISIESGNRTKYEQYLLKIDPNDMHSLIYYADLFIGDSQSMHVEACLLGTPSIRSNSWVTAKDRVSVIDYLEIKCQMGVSIAPDDQVALLGKVKLLLRPDFKEKSRSLSKRFFEENTNLTDFLFWMLSNYFWATKRAKQKTINYLKKL